MNADKLRLRLIHVLAGDMFAARLRTWIVRRHGQTLVVVADWLRARTDRGYGLDKATASRRDNGADISHINRDYFADIRTLRLQGVRRPLSNPHKIVWALELT